MPASIDSPVTDDPFDFAKHADPYPGYRRVRETTPVYWSELLHSWVLTRYGDVKAALTDSRLSAALTREAQAAQLSEELRHQLAPVDELLGRWALFQDDPAHQRIRSALLGAFKPRLMAQLERRVRAIADELVDAAKERGELDLVGDFALQLPARVIAELLGMPGDDAHRFQPWVHTIATYFAIGSLGNVVTIAALRETVEQLADYMREIVDEHRRSPTDDLIGSLLAFEHEGEPLREVEILSQCMLLLHGGYESTMNTISSGMLHILRDPQLRAAPELAAAAVEETLRYEPAFQFVVRVATTDLELADRPIRRGQQVVCVLGAANRDPAQFTDPEQFDPRRHPNPHLGFGYGPHYCIGAQLARIEAKIAIETLLRRLEGLELATDVPQWRPAFGVRSLATLPVRFSRVAPPSTP
jgi:pimeloyl-[acyl-carrier protein] synthase